MPVGPSILWPEKARKSQPRARTSTGMWGTACAASITIAAPEARAALTIRSAASRVPSTLETSENATRRVRGPIASQGASSGEIRRTAPVTCATRCQGSRFEWCSNSVTAISSPGPSRRAAQPCATRLIDSVVPWVKMTEATSGAPMKRRTASRAPSSSWSASSASRYTPRCTFALEVS